MLFYKREIFRWPMYNAGIISAFLQNDSKMFTKLIFSLTEANILGVREWYTGYYDSPEPHVLSAVLKQNRVESLSNITLWEF